MNSHVVTDSLADKCRLIAQDRGLLPPIPGLLFKVPSLVLSAHCKERAAYHAARAETKTKEIPGLEEAVANLSKSIDKIKGYASESVVPRASAKSLSNSNYGFDGRDQVQEVENQIERLRQDIKEHQNKSAQFTFLSESFFDGVYALDWDNLNRLELVK